MWGSSWRLPRILANLMLTRSALNPISGTLCKNFWNYVTIISPKALIFQESAKENTKYASSKGISKGLEFWSARTTNPVGDKMMHVTRPRSRLPRPGTRLLATCRYEAGLKTHNRRTYRPNRPQYSSKWQILKWKKTLPSKYPPQTFSSPPQFITTSSSREPPTPIFPPSLRPSSPRPLQTYQTPWNPQLLAQHAH